MPPFLASGAGQATEVLSPFFLLTEPHHRPRSTQDGFILGQILSQPTVTRDTVTRALAVYDAVRRPFAQEVQRLSDEHGRIYHLRRLGWEELSAEQSAAGEYTPDMLRKIEKAIAHGAQWTLEGSAMEERDKALRMLEAELAN